MEYVRRYPTWKNKEDVGGSDTFLSAATMQHIENGLYGAVAPDPALRPWLAAVGNADVAPAKAVVVGDSIGEGAGATQKARRWVDRWQAAERRRRAFPAGGEGYVAAMYSPGAGGNMFSGSWDYGGGVAPNGTFGLGRRSVVMGATGYAARQVFGTSVQLAYMTTAGGGTFRVLVDGSQVATQSTTGGATTRGGGRLSVPLGTRGAHTVRVEHLSGGNLIFCGMHVYDGDETAGIHIIDSSQYGSSSADWATSGTAYTLADELDVIQPDLLVVCLGGNDRMQNMPVATHRSNLEAIIDDARAVVEKPLSVVALGEYQLGNGTYAWQDYIAAQRTLVGLDSLACHVDLTRRMPTASAGDSLGLYHADGVHLADRGHGVVTDTILAATSAR